MNRLRAGGKASERVMWLTSKSLIQRRLENAALLCFQSLTATSNRRPLSIRSGQKLKSALSETTAGTLFTIIQSLNCPTTLPQHSVKREKRILVGSTTEAGASSNKVGESCRLRPLALEASHASSDRLSPPKTRIQILIYGMVSHNWLAVLTPVMRSP
jgi:hypothetical protein